MDEPSAFEVRAVLAPKRARWSRLALLLPVVTLVAVAWVGSSGPRARQATADGQATSGTPAPTHAPQAHPATVIGLAVHRLDQVQPRGLGPDDPVALAGWYVAKAITDCPPLAAIYRDGSLPWLRGDADKLAFCRRSGLLYASSPDEERGSGGAGPSVVQAALVVGVIAPRELEVLGGEAIEVVLIGHFAGSGDACASAGGCDPKLLVDYVGWTPAT